MLALEVVEEINRLLKEGKHSQRRIAELLQVSRATVSAIAGGRRALFGRAFEGESKESSPLQPAERCPTCGFLVYAPCLVCRTREYRQERRELESLAAGRGLRVRRGRRPPVRRPQRKRRARVA